MPTLNREAVNIQNPAIGAFLLWRFIYGYERGSETKELTPFPLLFLVLPVLMHEETFVFIVSTREGSGLRKFTGKFSEAKNQKRDVLLSLQNRCNNMKNLTMRSLSLAISSNLVSIDHESARAISLSSSSPKTGIPQSITPMIRCSERLGVWCSKLSLHEVSTILKVEF